MSGSVLRPVKIPPSMRVMQFIWPGAMAVQAIYVATKLGLADLVKDGPKTLGELARETRTHGPSLYRLLRALKSLGIFAEDKRGRFRHTPLSETLRSERPQSIRAWVLMLGAPFIWKPCGELYEAVLTGKPSFERIFRTRFFDYFGENPDDAAIFNSAMGSRPVAVSKIMQAYDFSKFERIVDVGGGQGELLQGILSQNPKTHGFLYDLPGVVAGAKALRTSAFASRCEIVAGDFFEEVPQGGDAYILKNIIHDWSDQEALKILKNCRRAIKPDGTLLIIDAVLKPSKKPDTRAEVVMTDLLMLVLLGGRERTESEFRALLRGAGFSLKMLIPAGDQSIIESQPG